MWFANRFTSPRNRRRKPASNPWLALLKLDDRCLPSGFNVINLGNGTAYDLNNVGQVVGNMGVLNWQTGTTTGPIGVAITDAGQVAGGNTLFDPTGGATNLGHLPGDTSSYANDLNMAGQVVGVSESGATGVYAGAASTGADNSHAYLWDAVNGMQSLGPFPSGNYSTATCINEGGQVVGWAQYSWMNGAYQTRQLGFVRDSTGQLTLFTGLLGYICSEARGVNDLGQVVGSAGHDFTLPHGSFYVPDQAFVWQNGVATGLGVPAGYLRTEAWAINNSGQVVALAFTSTFSTTDVGHPFLWQNGVWTDLGFSYAKSVNINNDGQILVALAPCSTPSGSYLLNPVDPNAPSLALTGFASPTTAGVAGSFTVTATNADGTTASGYTGTIHFTSSDVQAGLPATYTFTAADAGMHTFSATLKTAGTQSITATDFAAGVVGNETGIVVTPAAASRLSISGPSSVSAGVAFSITVAAYDSYGNLATGYVGTVHFSSSDGRAALPANYAFTSGPGGDNGVHTFAGLVLRKKGTQTITVTDMLVPTITSTWSEYVI